MTIERRQFLKLSAAITATAAFGGLGFDLKPAFAQAELSKFKFTKQTTSVCCYCSVGCGLIVNTAEDGHGRAVNVEGDPDHPVNEGSLCPKGASIWQLVENDKRLTKPMYRAPYSDKWEEKPWDWALDRIARKVKDTRDATFELKNAKDQIVNRVAGMASVGSAAMDNEECWIYQSMLRAMGLTYIEHQARI
jgi:formate dehydrogenase major subunit